MTRKPNVNIGIIYERPGQAPVGMTSTAFKTAKDALRALMAEFPGGQQTWGALGIASYDRPDGTRVTLSFGDDACPPIQQEANER